MSDIVERLRRGHHNADLVTVGGVTHDGRCLIAADEIERLRAGLRPFVEYIHDDIRRGHRRYVLTETLYPGGGWIGSEDFRNARDALQAAERTKAER